jgi:hypothetical protein
MTPVIDRFWRAYRLELRLATRNLVYPLLHLGWLALLIWQFYGTDDRTAQALLETSLGRLTVGILSLVALFMAGLIASRSQQARFTEIEDSFPSGHEIPLARLSAGLTALLAFSLEALALAAVQGPFRSLLAGAPLFMAELILTLALCMAFAWWLFGWLRIGRWVYPLLAGGWLVFLIGPGILARENPAFSLLNFMRQGLSGSYSELWGRISVGVLPYYFNLFYVGLAALFLAIFLAGTSRRRFRRFPVAPSLLSIIALFLAGVAAIGYTNEVARAGETLHSPIPIVSEPIHPTITAYDLDIDFSDGRLLKVKARIVVLNDLENSLSELDLYLNESLAVTEASQPFSRNGVHLIFTPEAPLQPGESLGIDLSYAGPVWDFVYTIAGGPQAIDFVHPHGIRLSPQSYWYPAPLYRYPDASFDVQITGAPGLKFGSNLPQTGPRSFQSKQAGWFFLFGGKELVADQVSNVTIYAARNDMTRVRELSSMYSDALEHYLRFFPDLEPEGLLLISLGEETGLPYGTPPSDGRLVVVISRWILSGSQRSEKSMQYSIGEALVKDLWVLGEGHPSGIQYFVLHELNRFLWAHYRSGGELQPGSITVYPTEEYQDSLTYALEQIYLKHGEAGIIRVTLKLRTHSYELAALDFTQMQAWLFEAAR